jgi:hypothetical protein
MLLTDGDLTQWASKHLPGWMLSPNSRIHIQPEQITTQQGILQSIENSQ